MITKNGTYFEPLRPYKIAEHPVWKDGKRFVYDIRGFDWYGSLHDIKEVSKIKGHWNVVASDGPAMEFDEFDKAWKCILQEKEDFKMGYVKFCNTFGYDANDEKSVEIWEYGRRIHGISCLL